MAPSVAEADLYQVEPGQFTAARNALAKQMKAEGQRDEAARVAKLRRPPVTAWALNQVARQQPDLIGAVLESGGRLRAAMEKAVGGDASGLHDAKGAQRQAVDAAVAAAVLRLEAAGHAGSETAKQRMGATLGAAVVDEAVATQLRDGVLDGDRSAPGDRVNRVDRVDRAGRREAEAAERERRRQARSLHATLEAEANRLGHRAGRLQARAEEAERQAAETRATADDATAEADDARSRAEAARPDDD
jgi:hypothetical protein